MNINSETDKLTNFLFDILQKGDPLGYIPFIDEPIVRKIEDVVSITWFRYKEFQVQLFAVPPNYIIPEHTHPNVDSYEVLLGGEIGFSKNGRWVNLEDLTFPPRTYEGLNPARGGCIRVNPEDPHGGVSGRNGATFLSVQRWLNGVTPHCVANDYTGKTMGSNHSSQVKSGYAENPVSQKNLTWRDAASLETVPPKFYFDTVKPDILIV